MPVPDGRKGLGIPGYALGEKAADLLHKSGIEHSPDADFDPAIALLTKWIQSDRAHSEALQRMPWLKAQMFGKGLACFEPDFERPDDLRFIARRNPACGCRVETLQQTMQILPALLFGETFETLPPILG